MAITLQYRIDMPFINDDGTVEVIDRDTTSDYPFTWQYKIYDTFEENLKSMFAILYPFTPPRYEFTPKMEAYINNRRALYEEAKQFRAVVDRINESSLSSFQKKHLIKEFDLILNEVYPYKE